MTVHKCSTQNHSDYLPSYPKTIIIAQMLSIGGGCSTETKLLTNFGYQHIGLHKLWYLIISSLLHYQDFG